jgi:beta-galactosidase/beta-glucuronidase
MEVGNHIGGYTPFSFDISHCLNDGPAEISITIYAEDDIQSLGQSKGKQSHILASAGCDYTRTTGIWQTVWLEAVHRTYLASVRITPQLSANGALVEARVNGDSIDGGRVRFRAYAQEAVAGEALLPVSGKAAGAFLPISQVRAWSPEDPFLYDLEITLESVDGEVLDAVHSYFGLRNVEISGSAILINGKAVFQRLILDQGYYPTGIYTAPTDSDLRNDIELSLSMGFNGARLHQKVFDPRYLYWCDRLGYLVWGESPDWGLDVTQTEHLAGFLQTWVEALERDYNHPSIIGWCPFNEHDFTKTPETVRSIYRLTKALDTSRPVIDSSGWTHVETDILDVHDYEQDPVAFDTRHRQLGIASVDEHPSNDESDRRAGLFAQLPYMVSEFGGIWWNPGQASDEGGWGYGAGPASPAEFLARYRGLVESLLNNPKIFAFCYTQLTDVEQEVNGLCTYDRKPKFDSSEIRAITAQVAAIERLFADR